jgi:hypothetical protein
MTIRPSLIRIKRLRATGTGKYGRPDRRSKLLIVLIAVGPALAIAACGSAAKPQSASSSHALTAAVKLAACMRSHGLSTFPDPAADGAAPTVTIDKQSPAYIAAANACNTVAMGAGPAEARTQAVPSARRQAALISLDSCIRSHGVPSLPDKGTAAIGFDRHSPAFINAAHVCETHAAQTQVSP